MDPEPPTSSWWPPPPTAPLWAPPPGHGSYHPSRRHRVQHPPTKPLVWWIHWPSTLNWLIVHQITPSPSVGYGASPAEQSSVTMSTSTSSTLWCSSSTRLGCRSSPTNPSPSRCTHSATRWNSSWFVCTPPAMIHTYVIVWSNSHPIWLIASSSQPTWITAMMDLDVQLHACRMYTYQSQPTGMPTTQIVAYVSPSNHRTLWSTHTSHDGASWTTHPAPTRTSFWYHP